MTSRPEVPRITLLLETIVARLPSQVRDVADALEGAASALVPAMSRPAETAVRIFLCVVFIKTPGESKRENLSHAMKPISACSFFNCRTADQESKPVCPVWAGLALYLGRY